MIRLLFSKLNQLKTQQIFRQRYTPEQAIDPEVWPSLLELGRGTAREEMCHRGAIAERRLILAEMAEEVDRSILITIKKELFENNEDYS
jgi:hypothetical protein